MLVMIQANRKKEEEEEQEEEEEKEEEISQRNDYETHAICLSDYAPFSDATGDNDWLNNS